MSGERGRLGRFTDAVLGGARAARDKARELRDEFRTSDEPGDVLWSRRCCPGQELRYVGLGPVRMPADPQGRSAARRRDCRRACRPLDPKVLFGLLNIVNPVVWVDAVLTPVRLAAGVAAAAGQGRRHRRRCAGGWRTEAGPAPPHRARSGSRSRSPRSRRRSARCSGSACTARWPTSSPRSPTVAGSSSAATSPPSPAACCSSWSATRTPLAVTDTHVHLLRMGPRPGRRPARPPSTAGAVECAPRPGGPGRLRAGRDRARAARRPPSSSTTARGSGSTQPALRDDQSRFLTAIQDLPGQRPSTVTRRAGHGCDWARRVSP